MKRAANTGIIVNLRPPTMSEFKNYRKKPVIIQARQFNRSKFISDPTYHNSWGDIIASIPTQDDPLRLGIKTLEDDKDSYHIVSDSDYIIRGIKGEMYACKPDVFMATYDDVD